MTKVSTKIGTTLQVSSAEIEQWAGLATALEEDQQFRDAFLTNPRAAVKERDFDIPEEMIPTAIESLEPESFLPEMARFTIITFIQQ